MAEFTVIPDANLEPDKPARAIDALALRDNPIAIAEGAAGAPRIQTAALDDNVVTDAKLGTTATSAGTDWVLARTAGAAVGAVGTYAFLNTTNTTAYTEGTTLAGSSLRYSSGLNYSQGTSERIAVNGGTPSGTWRAMGRREATNDGAAANSISSTLWLRIS